MYSFTAVFLFLLLSVVSCAPKNKSQSCQSTSTLRLSHPVQIDSGLYTYTIFKSLTSPRGIKFDSAFPPNLLVIESGLGLSALSPVIEGNCTGWMQKRIVNNTALNHGLEIDGNYVYASSADSVFRYFYDPDTVTVSGNMTTIVTNMFNDDHSTRTLLLQPSTNSTPQYLIVTRGSASNIDPEAADVTSGHSQIRRFSLSSSSIPNSGYDWKDGQLLAWGMRNAVGIALSQDNSRLWEVENSADDVTWMGDDVHQDNPAEELNLVDLSTLSSSTTPYYGYPWCFTAWGPSEFKKSSSDIAPTAIGDQFSISDAFNTSWCNDSSNVVKPTLNFQAHSAPLDIKFYTAPTGDTTFAINPTWSGDAFVTFHGSWNRDPPTGYGIVRIPWFQNNPIAPPNSSDGYSFILQAPDVTKCPSKCIRPVAMAFDSNGRLFVSSDSTGEIFVIESSSAPDALPSSGGLEMGVKGVLLPFTLVTNLLLVWFMDFVF